MAGEREGVKAVVCIKVAASSRGQQEKMCTATARVVQMRSRSRGCKKCVFSDTLRKETRAFKVQQVCAGVFGDSGSVAKEFLNENHQYDPEANHQGASDK